MKTKVLSLLMLCVLAQGAIAVEPITLKLWPDGPPTAMVPKSDATVKFIKSYRDGGPNRITDVSDPTMTVFRPDKPNGTSVIVAPGGGFMFLSYAHEGTQVCEWLNSLGVTAVLLKYRTPTRDEKEMFDLPVQDAERALGLVRHHAAEWKLDPQRVGLLGFSAGANLAGHVSWDRGHRTYPQNPEHDDNANPIEAAMLYLEYKKRDLSAELHICAKGGHGFGMRKDGKPINDWPQRCAEWMTSLSFLPAN